MVVLDRMAMKVAWIVIVEVVDDIAELCSALCSNN